MSLWGAIDKAAKEKPAPVLIYHESNLIIRAIRDYLRSDINEILIDSQELYKLETVLLLKDDIEHHRWVWSYA